MAVAYRPEVVVDGHVSWVLLTSEEQADLLANYPHQVGLNEAQEQAWLDTSWRSRWSVAIGQDPWS